jgi:hypothetical protein
MDPVRFAEIIDGLRHEHPLVRMRSADAAEKISAARPEWLQRHKQTRRPQRASKTARHLLSDIAAAAMR